MCLVMATFSSNSLNYVWTTTRMSCGSEINWSLNSEECGPSAITFTLGYMSEQGLIDGYDASTWTDFNKVRKAVKLVSKGAFKGAIWPWNIDDGIRAIAPHYKVVQKGRNGV